jgi:septin family protein
MSSQHSDLAALKKLLFEVAFEDLKAQTDKRYYGYRAAQMLQFEEGDMYGHQFYCRLGVVKVSLSLSLSLALSLPFSLSLSHTHSHTHSHRRGGASVCALGFPEGAQNTDLEGQYYISGP